MYAYAHGPLNEEISSLTSFSLEITSILLFVDSMILKDSQFLSPNKCTVLIFSETH